MAFNLVDLTRRFTRFRDGIALTRKNVLICLLSLGLILYLGPTLFRILMANTPIMIDSKIGCVDELILPYVKKASVYDATYSKGYSDSSPSFIPYIGNGKFGLPLVDQTTFYIKRSRSLNLNTNYNPIIRVGWREHGYREATAVDFTTGIGAHFQCYKQTRRSITVEHQFFADRSYPSLLVQSITITNNLLEDITLSLYQSDTSSSDYTFKPLKDLKSNDGLQYVMLKKTIKPSPTQSYVYAILAPTVPETVVLKAGSTKTLNIRTFIDYSPVQYEDALEVKLLNEARDALTMDVSELKMNHEKTWQQLWSSGFGISESKAQGAINGDKINATFYYLMANSRTYQAEVTSKESPIPHADRCYDGHHTIQASTLWSNYKSIDEVNKVVNLWFLTLGTQACQDLLNSGAEGTMQAALLSLGAFKFSHNHLEFRMRPDDLHRDYFFRRISYGNSTHLNVSVRVGEDNKAIIYTALDRQDKDYYACDAGCLDPPIKLGPSQIQFPVKLTDPMTAILYITADHEHMLELKHTIHVKEIVEAPAHQHHVLALHRHGHQLGGLPALFWLSIAFLIVVFHLFLAKLIYNEYCGGQSITTNPRRGRYVV